MDQHPPSDAPEVTTTHKPWFKRGGGMAWDKLEDYDRTWPTVPRISRISSLFHGSLDASILFGGVLLMALIFVVLT